MGRLVQPAQFERVSVRGGVLESARTTMVAVGGDTYSDRVAKYIPGEVLAAYVSLDGMITDKAKGAAASAASLAETAAPASGVMALYPYLPFGVLLLGLIFTPLYIRQLALRSAPGTPWATQAIISSIAFLIWAYAIQGGAFSMHENVHDGTIASAALIIFTLASGLFEPRPVNPHDGN